MNLIGRCCFYESMHGMWMAMMNTWNKLWIVYWCHTSSSVSVWVEQPLIVTCMSNAKMGCLLIYTGAVMHIWKYPFRAGRTDAWTHQCFMFPINKWYDNITLFQGKNPSVVPPCCILPQSPHPGLPPTPPHSSPPSRSSLMPWNLLQIIYFATPSSIPYPSLN